MATPAGAAGTVERLDPADAIEGDNYGSAVRVDGDTAVVSAPLQDEFGINAGAVYIFERAPEGTGGWLQTRKVGGAEVPDFGFFGKSVAVDGDVVVVGTPESLVEEDGWPDGVTNKGSAYVFERDAGGSGNWGQVARLGASDGALGDEFGRACAVAGDAIAVGAQFDDDDGQLSGSVYLYNRTDDLTVEWPQTDKLTASDAQPFQYFGSSLAMHEPWLAVGAPGDFFASQFPGAVYVFRRAAPPFTSWSELVRLSGSDAVPGDRFGSSVALRADLLAVGTDNEAVYVFERSDGPAGDEWNEVAKLTPDDAVPGSGFGASVGVDGSTVVVGAPFDGADGAGAVYAFTHTDDDPPVWYQLDRISIPDTGGDRVGLAVAAGGGAIVMGAPLSDDAGTDAGSAYATGLPADEDYDGIPDATDNCSLIPNGPIRPDHGGQSQRDTAGDGFGNVCDSDLNNDCIVDFLDLAEMRMAFFATGDLDADLNGDGVVNFTDLAQIKLQFFAPPGPSGVTNNCGSVRIP